MVVAKRRSVNGNGIHEEEDEEEDGKCEKVSLTRGLPLLYDYCRNFEQVTIFYFFSPFCPLLLPFHFSLLFFPSFLPSFPSFLNALHIGL